MLLHQRIQFLPVGRKLLVALSVLLASTLVAANLTFISATYWISRQNMAPQAMQSIISLMSLPALSHTALQGHEQAKQLLQRLENHPPLRAAAIYDYMGQQLALLYNGDSINIPPQLADVEQWRADEFRVSLLAPLPQANGHSGYLLLVARG